MATDQEIQDRGIKFLPKQQYLQSPYQFDEPVVEEEITETFGVPNTTAFTNSGRDNNFNRSFSNNPYTAQPSGSFVTNRTNYGSSGYLPGTEPEETYMDKIGGLIKTGIGMAIPGGNFLMGMADKLNRFDNLSAQDQAFIEMQKGINEQSIHGFGNLPNQDRYGYNKVSMLGNYANVVSKRVDIANKRIAEGKELRPIDNYYLEKAKEEEDVKNKIDFNDFVKQRITANNIRNRIQNDPTYNENFNIHNDAGDNITTNPNKTGYGFTGSGAFKNIDNSGKNYGPHSKGDTESQTNSQAGAGGFYDFANGGRVNYKVGGRTDAESQYGEDSAGSYDSSTNQSDRDQSYGTLTSLSSDISDSPINNFKVINASDALGFKYPTGFTTNLGIGQLTAILNAKKSIEEEKPEFMAQYETSMGPINTNISYDTTTGPEFNASYTGDNYGINYNTDTGLSGNYSKEIGPGTFTAGGNLRPDGTYDTEARYGISFANGGLASIL